MFFPWESMKKVRYPQEFLRKYVLNKTTYAKEKKRMNKFLYFSILTSFSWKISSRGSHNIKL